MEALPFQREPAREPLGGAGLGAQGHGLSQDKLALFPQSRAHGPPRGADGVPGRGRATKAAEFQEGTGFCGRPRGDFDRKQTRTTGLGSGGTGALSVSGQGRTPRGSDGRLRGLWRPQESSDPGRGERSQEGTEEPGFKPQRPEFTYQSRTFASGNPLPG